MPSLYLQEFQKIGGLDDLISLLNKVKLDSKLIKSPNDKITNKDYNYHWVKSNSKYRKKVIPKKNGKQREIYAPDSSLITLQRLFLILLGDVYTDFHSKSSHGFRMDKSIITNASFHIGKREVLNMDIKNFFPSISFRRVKSVLELNPFNLSGETEEIAFSIANLLTLNGFLPQGAPTSPLISNIVCSRLDRKLRRLARENRVAYSRYADDLSFSTKYALDIEPFVEEVKSICEAENFTINEEKTRCKDFRTRQEVTGLITNTKVNVKRKYIRDVRCVLYNWEKKGIYIAEEKFLETYSKRDRENIDFRNVIYGKINFIGQVKGISNPVYVKLRNWFSILYNKIDYDSIINLATKKKLADDNYKMESIVFSSYSSEREKFIDFCTSAFHQIENLINYHYYCLFEDIEDFKRYMLKVSEASTVFNINRGSIKRVKK